MSLPLNKSINRTFFQKKHSSICDALFTSKKNVTETFRYSGAFNRLTILIIVNGEQSLDPLGGSSE
ncbi:hypothetical protein yberc0001_15920 [Yersinia bercovieri ATCC 43970]|uniref:Uncharacterized protein n=2 Tax=Yersinia bercovieri TaxID=634 RepID=A0A2G4TZ73_YERBE|nr:hypothetical protein yberc0001_15920 [Yersinia bercovieri ATCC 43970]PHZ26347.1 hypothetical protein CS533_16420 [Yersinia bercovieri]